jgi:16S rRNA (cytosine967-C5)-methyltransferase
MQHLANEQSRLLEALWPLLKPGGRMLYATCSLFAAENTDQMTAFIARHPDAQLTKSDKLNAAPPNNAPSGQILPGPDTDGFFYASLLKT